MNYRLTLYSRHLCRAIRRDAGIHGTSILSVSVSGAGFSIGAELLRLISLKGEARLVVHVDGVRLCMWTAATSVPFVYLSDGI
jgi:hypothetical protein